MTRYHVEFDVESVYDWQLKNASWQKFNWKSLSNPNGKSGYSVWVPDYAEITKITPSEVEEYSTFVSKDPLYRGLTYVKTSEGWLCGDLGHSSRLSPSGRSSKELDEEWRSYNAR